MLPGELPERTREGSECWVDEDSRPSRERILDAAQRLFALHGFDATTTKRISREAGVPNGLIHYHFGTKRELLGCLLRERAFLPELKALLEEATSTNIRSTLVRVGVGYYEALKRHEELVRILFGEFHIRGEVFEYSQEIMNEVLERIASYMEDAAERARLRRNQIEAATQVFMSGILVAAVFKAPRDPGSFVEQSVDLLLEGLVERS